MLGTVVIQVGEEAGWQDLLTLATTELNVQFLWVSSLEELKSRWDSSENGAILFDTSGKLGRVQVGQHFGSSPSHISVCALPSDVENSDLSKEKLDNYDHVATLPDSLAPLIKSIQFYLKYLQVAGQLNRTGASHETVKKNVSLTHQVTNLQGQLSQYNADLQTREEVLSKINRISQLSRQINCLNLKRISLVCIEKIPELISARFASIYLYNEQDNVLQLLRHNHPYSIEREVHLSEHPNSPMAIAIQQQKTQLIKDFNDWKESNNIDINRPFVRNYQTNSCIIAPLHSSGKIAGLLNLADKMDGEGFDHDIDMPPVELLCEIVGSAMSNIKLYEEVKKQARTDGMTGLVNHTTFYNELDKEVSRSRRYGGHLTLIMIDVDRLKSVNDEYGHRAGDAMLTHVSNQILYCIRETDIAARYGGDEFSIILPNTSLSDALVVAQRMMDYVSNCPIQVEEHSVQASISIGLAQYQKEFTTEIFMREADGALLAAKGAGKNCIHISDPVEF
jgi:diguanylate cyclase (GGDEF)-like protein